MPAEHGLDDLRALHGREFHALHRSAVAVAPVVLEDGAAQGDVRRALQAAVDGRDHAHAVRVEAAAVLLEQRLAHQFRNVWRLDLDARTVQFAGDRFLQRGTVRLAGDEADFLHAAQHVGAAPFGLLAAGRGVVARRSLRQPGEQRRLGDAQLGQPLAEVGLGGRGDAIGALAEEHGVEVELEDLLLGEFVLERQRQEDLAQLASQGAFLLIRVVRTSCWVSVLPPWRNSM